MRRLSTMSAARAEEHLLAPTAPGTLRLRQTSLRLRFVVELLCFAVLPMLMVAVFVFSGGQARAFDFQQFWQGGRDVLEGVSPYPSAVPSEEAAAGLTPEQIQETFRFPYPAPAGFAMAPFALLPFSAASWVLLALLVAAVPASLLLLGVRDWRCYGAAFLWLPVLGGVRLGTLTPLLVLGVAAVWRFRDRARVAAPALAATVILKLFLWPLLLWLVATRRTVAAIATAALGAAATIGAWAAIAFAGFGDYPELLGRLAGSVQADGYSIMAFVLAAGGSEATGRACAFAVGAAALAAVAWIGRRGGDALVPLGLGLALFAALAISPIVWVHYFALLLVPVAVASPRLGAAWLVPLGFWLTPYHESDGEVWRIAVALAVVAATLAVASLRPASGRRGLLLRG